MGLGEWDQERQTEGKDVVFRSNMRDRVEVELL